MFISKLNSSRASNGRSIQNQKSLDQVQMFKMAQSELVFSNKLEISFFFQFFTSSLN